MILIGDFSEHMYSGDKTEYDKEMIVLVDGIIFVEAYLSLSMYMYYTHYMHTRGYTNTMEKYAEMCASQFAFDAAMRGYCYHVSESGRNKGIKDPEKAFYEVQKELKKYVLPHFKNYISTMEEEEPIKTDEPCFN